MSEFTTPFSTPTVFVCSATGSQGSALCHELRKLNWRVRATTRNPSSASAQALTAIGVELTKGDWEDEEALREGLTGCTKLFICLMPDFNHWTAEHEQTTRICALARQAGTVDHVVASSSLGGFWLDEGGRPPIRPGPMFANILKSKYSIERATRAAGFRRCTVVRPGFFMANFYEPHMSQLGYSEIRDAGVWRSAWRPETRIALIDHVDVARIAAAALQHPDAFDGRTIAAVSERVPVQEALDQLAAAVGGGKTLKAEFISDEELLDKFMAGVEPLPYNKEPCWRYMSDFPDHPEELKDVMPRMTTFREFLEREKDALAATWGSPSA